LIRIAMAMTFFVILAGSVVRMTGSGMGCPDWPKCFGLLIPPTDESEVTWKMGESYDEGRMVIEQDTLWVAQELVVAEDFGQERVEGKWMPYDRHDYAIFNPVHTWVEFVNRLLGALTGIPALLLFLFAVRRGIRKRQWAPFAWALVHLVCLAFVAWLGKKVVDGNLIPFSITIHMMGAIAILISLIGMMRAVGEPTAAPRLKRTLLWIATSVALAQVVMGTQVREQIDLLHQSGVLRSDWIVSLPEWWKIHRTGSWAVVLTQFLWMWPLRFSKGRVRRAVMMSLGLIGLQFLSGILFVWIEMPAALQPVHLLLAIGLVTVNTWSLFFLKGELESE